MTRTLLRQLRSVIPEANRADRAIRHNLTRSGDVPRMLPCARVCVRAAAAIAGILLPGVASAGTFTDYFKPTPIVCSPTSNAWGDNAVIPRDTCKWLRVHWSSWVMARRTSSVGGPSGPARWGSKGGVSPPRPSAGCSTSRVARLARPAARADLDLERQLGFRRALHPVHSPETE